jgi:hypothetical protein
MTMVRSRLALTLLARAGASGTREALIGDVLEEMSCGRSRWWLWQQLIGLYGLALVARARQQARLTPGVVALALGGVLLGAVAVGSIDSVVDAWLSFYLVAGTLSLFAHMLSRPHVDVRL